MTVTELGEL